MKISASIIALGAVQISAFVHPPLSRSFKGSALYSTIVSSSTTSGAVRAPSSSKTGEESKIKQIWDKSVQLAVQGGTLKTWAYESPAIERVQVTLKTEGRPLDADIELWQGPDNTPTKMRVDVEDGNTRPFSAIIETPRGPNTVAIRNIGHLEFPLAAGVVAESTVSGPVVSAPENLEAPNTIQGGALRTYPFDTHVDSVQVLLTTDGRPLNSRIELLQGPNNNKQVVEVYTEDGMDRPFFIILATPGAGNVIRICNTAPVEFPLSASVQAYEIGNHSSNLEPVLGGDSGVSSSPKLDLQW